MRWSYKTVHFGLKKDGLLGSAFLDEAEIEVSLNEYGHAGWELVSCMEVSDGLIAVFKQPLSRLSVSSVETPASEETDSFPEEAIAPQSTQIQVDAREQEKESREELEGESEMESDTGAGSIRIF